MLKRALTVVLALVLVLGLSGFALASNYSDTDQIGLRNVADVLQQDFAVASQYANDAYVLQDGNDNYADIWQQNNTGTVDALNDTDVVQDGNSNEAYVDQTISGDNFWNVAPVYQLGNDNVANITQTD